MSNARKVAVVTGASSGIGAVYARRLASRGHDLVLVARRLDRLEALKAEITKDHEVQVDLVEADLTTAEGLGKVERMLSTNPAIQVLVNNAGLARLQPLGQAPLADALAQIELNITALTRLTQAALPGLLARKSGAIINIASVLAIQSLPVSSVYSGTKAFVLQYSRGLQQELAGTGVRLQLVLPASTATEIWDNSGIPLSALDQSAVMTPEHLVDAALAGFDQGEDITWPSVHEAGLWDAYDQARAALFAATQTGRPAPRYSLV